MKKRRFCLCQRIEWAENDRIIYIAAPIKGGKIYPVSVGEELAIVFIKATPL